MDPSQRKGRQRPSPLETLAYHEAGHAVAAYALGVPLTCVRLDETTGGVDFGPYLKGSDGWPDRVWARKEAVVTLAGPAAEVVVRGGYSWRGRVFGEDRKNLYQWVCWGFRWYHNRSGPRSRPPDVYIHRLWVRALALLVRYWPAVCVLAAELLEHRQIEGRRARKIIKEAMQQMTQKRVPATTD